jgi:hypothetical protein
MLTKRRINVVASKVHSVTTISKRKLVPKKVITHFRTSIFSRHPSHSLLRRKLPLLPFRSLVRLGSITEKLVYNPKRVECNSVQGVKNSSSKLLMKQCFTRAGVKTADWWRFAQNSNTSTQFYKNITNTMDDISELPYPIVSKSHYGSRGEGNTLLKTKEELISWMRGKTLSNYIFERFYSYNREYRLHIGLNGCFYSCRKMLKSDSSKKDNWQRHDDNCVWVMETNPSFDKPVNWNLIVEDCVRAKEFLGLDICCFDVKIQSTKDSKGRIRENPEWIVIESGSAPSFGEITLEKYLVEIPKILKSKYERR